RSVPAEILPSSKSASPSYPSLPPLPVPPDQDSSVLPLYSSKLAKAHIKRAQQSPCVSRFHQGTAAESGIQIAPDSVSSAVSKQIREPLPASAHGLQESFPAEHLSQSRWPWIPRPETNGPT